MISIIVPIYNSQKYLEKCIESLINQTYRDIEIILVNDGSSDKSLDICRQYELKDERVKVISQNNQGTPKARKAGVDAAKGEYIIFCDSDDYMENNAVETLYLYGEKNRCDIVVGNYNRVYGKVKRRVKQFVEEQIIMHDEYMEKYYTSFFGVQLFQWSLWGRLYKSALLKDKNVSFYPNDGYKLLVGEDLYLSIQIYPMANIIGIIDKRIYNYRQGSGGTGKYNSNYMKDYKYTYYIRKEFISKYKLPDRYKLLMNVESVNVFRSITEQAILSGKLTKEDVLNFINETYTMDYMQETVEYFRLRKYDGKFKYNIDLLLNFDAEEYYLQVNNGLRKEKYKNYIRKIVMRILK